MEFEMNRGPGGGRQRRITGNDQGGGRRGSGLGLGPFGRKQGYSGRPGMGSVGGSGAGRSRGGGGSIIIIIIVAFLLLGGGGGLFSGLFGGGGSTVGTAVAGGALSTLGTLLGGGGSDYSSVGSVSGAWTASPNTGRLDSSVAEGSRAKYTSAGSAKSATVMVYLCGADLESKNGMATSDLTEMTKANISSDVDVIVYTGGASAWKNSIVSNKVNQIYKVETGGLRCLVKDDGKDSMVKPATLTRFIKYCTENYPADRYELIFWDHGGGTLSAFGYDEKNPGAGSMTLKGINQALNAAGTKFDFIGFDACLMATLETGLMLDRHADYLIASEETEPGVGWYYTDWLTKLSDNPSVPTVELGKKIVDDYSNYCDKNCSGQKTTLSVVDLAQLSSTVPEDLRAFSESTTELIESNNYKQVSDARSSSREFAQSSKIDQVDLVHLAYNIGTSDAKKLASSLLGAVKYNRTSSNMTNAYGISVYFPYRRTAKVESAVETFEAIGMDDQYSRCIQSFASVETGGQAASGGGVFSTLFGEGYSSPISAGSIGDILQGLTEYSGFFGRTVDVGRTAEYISKNQFNASALRWVKSDGKNVLDITDDQWDLVHDLQLSVFYDDGEGYIDLGLDCIYNFTEDGKLIGSYDGAWFGIAGQKAAVYLVDYFYDGDNYSITYRVPIMLNDESANLIVVFDNEDSYGYIAGVRYDYDQDETETIAKELSALEPGDKIDLVCDYYSYDGEYLDSYLFGNRIIYNESIEIGDVNIDSSRANAAYLITDIYNNEFWTPVIP